MIIIIEQTSKYEHKHMHAHRFVARAFNLCADISRWPGTHFRNQFWHLTLFYRLEYAFRLKYFNVIVSSVFCIRFRFFAFILPATSCFRERRPIDGCDVACSFFLWDSGYSCIHLRQTKTKYQSTLHGFLVHMQQVKKKAE